MLWTRPACRRLVTAFIFWSSLPGQPVRGIDCNENGLEDLVEVRSGAGSDCNENGVPDDCDLEPVNPVLQPSVDLAAEELGQPLRMGFADLDSDGDLDLLALSHLSWPPAIEVIKNDGTGSFATGGQFPLDLEPEHHAVGDLDGDGDLDIALAYLAPPYATVHLNAGGGTFPGVLALPVDEEVQAIATADLDGDEALDLVLARRGLIALRNRGGGEFSRTDFLEEEWFLGLGSGDLDGDGDADLVAMTRSGVLLLVNDAAGNLTGIRIDEASSRGDPVVEDMDEDGDIDIALALARDVLVLWNRGNAEFDRALYGFSLAPEFIADGTNPPVIAPADLDADGRRDLLVLCEGGGYTGAISFLKNLGGSAFSRGTIISGAGELTPPTMAVHEAARGGILTAASGWNGARIAILQKAAGINSRDCNQNAVPDECDVASLESADCDRDGVPDSCQSMEDCDENGSADRCDIARGGVPDCNATGVPDSCDIAAGTSLDLGGNGIPDECQSGFSDLFVLGFECPERIQGAPGEEKSIDVFATLTVDENAGPDSPQGWSVSIAVEGAVVESITLDSVHVSTIFDHDGDPNTPPLNPHDLDLGRADFKIAQKAERRPNPDAPPDLRGVVSAIVLHLVGSGTLVPGEVHRIARMAIKVTIPPSGASTSVRLWYQDGLRESHAPLRNVIVSDATNFSCRTDECTFGTVQVEPFLRCDPNDDLQVNIADPVWILNELFDAGVNPSLTKCPLAADCNGDGGKDISDPIFALSFLFTGGRSPPLPFPDCGTGDDAGSCDPETTACH